MTKKDKMKAKEAARLKAKVRPDEPVKEDRIYLNMPKKKTVAKKAPAKKTTKKGKK
mgnify:CR=1 FL=1|tara:strand:- start:235 stop:402 length:168 start_codon:yes stop_codon:yes gene_type:complete